MYYVYADFTSDGKPYYVGTGYWNRVKRLLGRNKRHTHTARKHGQERMIIGEFRYRENAILTEIKMIAQFHTFVDDPDYNGIGCNYTSGGEGCSCDDSTRSKISESIKKGFENGREVWNKGKTYTQSISDDERDRRRLTIVAFNKTKPWLGKHHSDDTRQKMRKPKRCTSCGELGHNKISCNVQKSPSFT